MGYPFTSSNFREQTTTKLEIEYGSLQFPAITLCNLNPVQFSKVQEVKALYQVIDETAQKLNMSMSEFGLDTTVSSNFVVKAGPRR